MNKLNLLIIGCLFSCAVFSSGGPVRAMSSAEMLRNITTNSTDLNTSWTIDSDGNLKTTLIVDRMDGINKEEYLATLHLSDDVLGDTHEWPGSWDVDALNRVFQQGLEHYRFSLNAILNRRRDYPALVALEDLSALVDVSKVEGEAVGFIRGRELGRVEASSVNTRQSMTTGVVLGAAIVGTAWYLSNKK